MTNVTDGRRRTGWGEKRDGWMMTWDGTAYGVTYGKDVYYFDTLHDARMSYNWLRIGHEPWNQRATQ